MRTYERLALAALIAAVLSAGQTLALDGTTAPSQAPAPTPGEAFRSGARALRAGEMDKGVSALEYAAEQGHMPAQWKLGRMYAEGDQVPKDDFRAFQYFSRVASSHAEDNPDTVQSRYVANAFVALGQYYLDGIPNSPVRADPARAREMFWYAASYFADPDAQYHLGRLYLEGTGAARDPRQAARWLDLAAKKGQAQAQALLGRMLFNGEYIPRQAARGLMWLTLARDAGVNEPWAVEAYDSAFRKATEDERALAFSFLERWMRERRE